MLEVVAGVLVRDGRILLAKRGILSDYPGKWECPGGKVEQGESHAQALARELWEELGIIVNVGRAITVARFYPPEFKQETAVHFYEAILGGHSPAPRSIVPVAFDYCTPKEMRRLDLIPANLQRIDELCSWVEAH